MSEMSEIPAAGETPEIQLLLDRAKELEEEIYATTGWDDPMPEQAVLDKMAELSAKIYAILNEISEIRLQNEVDAHEIPERVIVAFVETIDKAHRYFNLKQHLRECRYFEELNFRKDETFEILFERVKDDNLFNNDEVDIWNAVEAHLKEVRAEQSRVPRIEYMKNSRELKLKELYGNASEYTTEQHNEIDRRFPGLIWREPDILDGLALSDPVYNLVYQAREEGYVMNEDVKVEIKNVKKANPMFYDFHFIYQKPPLKYSDKEVLVTFSSLAGSVCEVARFLSSFVDVRHYEVISPRPTKVACVTLKDSQEAQRAVLLDLPKLNGKPITITPCQPAFDPFQSKDVRNASDIKNAVNGSDIKYAVNEALYRYSVFRSYRGKPTTKVVINPSANGAIDKTAKERGGKEGGGEIKVINPSANGAIDKTAKERGGKEGGGKNLPPSKKGGSNQEGGLAERNGGKSNGSKRRSRRINKA